MNTRLNAPLDERNLAVATSDLVKRFDQLIDRQQ